MEEAGAIVRLHGAVRLPPQEIEGPFDLRMQKNVAGKTRIAEAVVKFVVDGDTLFLDSGSTSCFVAKALGEHRQLKIITNSLAVAQAVRKDRGHTLFLAGGELNAAYQAFSDRHAQDFLAGFRPSLSILTVGAVSLEHGLMDHSPSEAIMSRIAYSTASRVPRQVRSGGLGAHRRAEGRGHPGHRRPAERRLPGRVRPRRGGGRLGAGREPGRTNFELQAQRIGRAGIIVGADDLDTGTHRNVQAVQVMGPSLGGVGVATRAD
jgi:hypothetical protein